MRVLFATSAWPTHYFTMVPLAWAFRATGHDVLVAAAPGMADRIARTGLPGAPFGPDIDLLDLHRRTLPFTRDAHRPPPVDRAETGEAGAETVFAAWREATLSGLGDLVALARRWRPDLIVCDTMCPGGLVAARVLDVPGVRHLWAVDILGSVEGERLLSVLPGFLEPFERYGVRVTGDPAVRTVDPCPPSLQPPPAPSRMQVQFVPYNGTGTFHEVPWMGGARSRPRACVTGGHSVSVVAGPDAFPAARAIRSLVKAGCEVVATLSPADREALAADIGDQAVLVDSAPLHMLLPHCDLVVHQGGAGSTLTAARYGVRQLSITCLPDQVQIAEPLARSGAGIQVRSEDADDATLDDSVARLLGDASYAIAAGRLRDEVLSQPAPLEVAERLVRELVRS